MVKIDMLETPYGPVSSKLNFARLSELTVPKIGIQTGPFGSQLHQDEYVDDGTPIITVEHLGENRIIHENLPKVSDDDKKRLNRYIINKGDIVFSRVGSVDKRSLVREKEDGWMFSGRCLRVRVDPGILDPTYLSYFFGIEGFKKYIRAVAVGATMPSINTQILSEIPIYYPSLQIQLKISAILSAFDDKIELNRQMNRTLEQMARALFKSWFIDFDPVHAKQRGEQPAGMDAETAALFPDRFVETDGKEIPEGWEIAKLGKLIDLDKGVSYKGEFLSQSGTPMLNLGTFFAKAGFKPGGIKYYTGDYKNKHTVEVGDIIIANTDLTQKREIIGSPAIVPKGIGSGDIIFTHHTFAVRNRGLVGQQFIYHIMQTDDYRERIIGHAHGTTVLAVKKDSLLELEIILPSSEIVDRFCIQASALYNCAEQNDIEIAHLTRLRDSLLPRLLSGELDVSDWENAIEAPEGAPA